MTVIALIGLEERERIAELRETERVLNMSYLMRSVLSEKAEQLRDAQSAWEAALGRLPGEVPGTLRDSEHDLIARILAEGLNPDQRRSRQVS